ncbi:cytokine-like nuclear factor N-PAC [Cylas formicarius]|uniref:cytokine-like nuclear factor N-PAC n=1 Tax=Cylas formicarius TaxID=197179 RepID=UPI0029583CE2|nr:cytokine-like nuclear factor N-PAC [Cylas formicarius]XP_060536272.1 cytokine-like nuclear factor N-PAC [Cylas formicarius]
MESEEQFRVKDFVWAKLNPWPFWPAIIVEPDPEAPQKPKKISHWVYFFGTHNYSWIEEKNLRHFKPFKDQFKKGYKSHEFKRGIEELEHNIAELEKDPDYVINYFKYVKEKKKPRKSGTGVKRPLSEKNSISPKKKVRNSLSVDTDNNDDNSTVGHSRPHSVSSSPTPNSPETQSILTSEKIFGFLGVGLIGRGVVKNLITSGHKVNVWNNSSWNTDDLKVYIDIGSVSICNTPRQVVRNSDIIFSCLSDPDSSKHIIQEFGIADKNDELLNGKDYVEMTAIDPETSEDISELIRNKNGRYLEALVQGGKYEAEKAALIVITAGNRKLYMDCQSCFKAMGKASFFVGDVGYAAKFNFIIQVMRGICLAALSEGFAMADRCGIKPAAFLPIFSMTNLASPYLDSKAKMIVNKEFSKVEEPLQNLQREVTFGLEMSNRLRQPMPLASTANEILKHARRLGYDNHDACCIYQRTRH